MGKCINCGIDLQDGILCSECLNKTDDAIAKAEVNLVFTSGTLCMFSNRLEFQTKNAKNDKTILYSEIQNIEITMKNLIGLTYKNGKYDPFAFETQSIAQTWYENLQNLIDFSKKKIELSAKQETSNVTNEENKLKIEENGQLYCRNCNAPIEEGTLCTNCLKVLTDDQLSIQERKKRNELLDGKNLLVLGFGIVLLVAGFFVMLFDFTVIGVSMMIIGAILCIAWYIRDESVCPNCQRRGTMEEIDKELVGTRDTFIKEKRKIEQTVKNGKFYINQTPDRYEYEVDVPATEYHYDVTYQCNKCKHQVIKRKTKTIKD